MSIEKKKILKEKSLPRKSFSEVSATLDLPNLTEIQRKAYNQFLYYDPKKSNQNLEDNPLGSLDQIFKSVFPINDFAGLATLEYVDYKLDKPKYTIEECLQRGITYSAPLYIIVRLIVMACRRRR